MNHGKEPIELEVELEAAADFADLFEVKDKLAKKGELYSDASRTASSCSATSARRFVRETVDHPPSEPARAQRGRAALPRHARRRTSSWTTCFDVRRGRRRRQRQRRRARSSSRRREPQRRAGGQTSRTGRRRRAAAQSAAGSRCERDLPRAAWSTWRRCASARRCRRTSALPAAGLPWFMAMFGRDSLITSFQALPFAPELARDHAADAGRCCRARARRSVPRRGAGQDPARAAPRRADRVRGAAALALLRRGRLDAAVPDPARRVRALDRRPRAGARRSSARRAPRIDWIDEYGDRDGDGYVEYERRNPETGLENQCWKDSWDSIAFADGTLAPTAARDLRDPGLRLRRQGPHRAAGARGLERSDVGRRAGARGRRRSSGASTATSGSPSAASSRSRSTARSARSTR